MVKVTVECNELCLPVHTPKMVSQAGLSCRQWASLTHSEILCNKILKKWWLKKSQIIINSMLC